MPNKLLFSFAALIYFYKGERNSEKIQLSDSPEYLNLYSDLWGNFDGTDQYLKHIVETILGLEALWKKDLNSIDGLKNKLASYLIDIERKGIKEAIREIL